MILGCFGMSLGLIGKVEKLKVCKAPCCLHAGVRLPELAPRAQRLEHGTTPAKEKMHDTTMSEIVLPDGTRLEGVAAQKVFILPPPFYV